MKNLYVELAKMLEGHFNGLKFENSFISNLPYLRFDLQGEKLEPANNNYFKEVQNRVTKIFKEAHSQDDEVFVLFQKNYYKRNKIRKRGYLFQQFHPSVQFQFRKLKTYILHLDLPGILARQVIFKDIVRNIDFDNLFQAIANVDFGRTPSLRGQLFIINTTKNTIMNMYDDRGCDIISKDDELLKKYYNDLSTYILEYNRAEIIEKLGIEK